MKNLKRLMSVVLSVVMLLSFVISTSAATFTDVAETDNAFEAIEVLAALKILEGKEAGVFDPEANIKRSEFAAVICRAMNQSPVGLASFVDVPEDHWAYDYIAWAASQNIVKGKGEGKFDPDANVTYNEAITMIVRAMGYEYYVEEYLGGFPTGYTRIAGSYKIDSGVNTANGNAAASRADVAKLVYNAFEAPLMDYSYAIGNDTEYVIYNGTKNVDYEKRTLLSYYADIYKFKVTVDKTFKNEVGSGYVDNKGNKKMDLTIQSTYGFKADQLYDALGKKYDDTDNLTTPVDETEFAGIIANNEAWADYAGYIVDAYITVNEAGKLEVVAMVPVSAGEELVIANAREMITKADVSGSTVVFEYEDENGKDAELDIAAAAMLYYNNIEVGAINAAGATIFNKLDLKEYPSVTLRDTDDDGIYDNVYVTDYIYGMVEEVDVDYEIIETTGETFALSADDTQDGFSYNIYKDGEAIGIEDLVAGDMLNVVVGALNGDISKATFVDIYVTNNTIESSVSSVSGAAGSEKYVIDGEEFYLAKNAKCKSLNPGDTGIFYITIDGYLYNADFTSTYSDNYAFILDAGDAPSAFGTTWQVKLLKKDNTVVTLPVKSTLTVTIQDTTSYTDYTVTPNKVYADGKLVKGQLKADGSTVAGYTDVTDFFNTYVKGLIEYQGTGAGEEAAAVAYLKPLASQRLITYKESNGEISEMVFSIADTGTDGIEVYGANDRTFNASALTSGDYKENTKRLAGQKLLDSTVMFNMPAYTEVGYSYLTYNSTGDIYKIDADKIQVYAWSSLKEGVAGGYSGALYNVDKNGIGAVLVTEKMGFSGNANALAVVTSISTGLDAAGNSATVVTFMQAGETQSLVVNDDGDGAALLKAASAGDVFQYNLNAAGEISASLLIYDYSDTYLRETSGGAGSDIEYKLGIVTDNDGSDVQIGGSYISWNLADDTTNVLFNTAREGKANAFSDKNGTSFIRKHSDVAAIDKLDTTDTSDFTDGTQLTTYTSDVYVVVLKVVDDEITDVVSYLYEKDNFVVSKKIGNIYHDRAVIAKSAFDAQFSNAQAADDPSALA